MHITSQHSVEPAQAINSVTDKIRDKQNGSIDYIVVAVWQRAHAGPYFRINGPQNGRKFSSSHTNDDLLLFQRAGMSLYLN